MVDFSSLPGGAAGLGALAGLFAAFFVVFLIIAIALWIYSSLAFVAISKKAKLSSPGLSWIPGIGPTIQTYRISKMHWWPWLLIIGFFIPFLNIVAGIVFAVYSLIWLWKTYEAIDRPGWWAIVPIGGIIPFVGVVFSIAGLVLIGIAAWGK